MEPTDFGADGAEFVRSQLALADEGYHLPLAARSRELPLTGSVGFYPPVEGPEDFPEGVRGRAEEKHSGWECLYSGLASWISRADGTLVLEEALARWSHPVVQRREHRENPLHHGEFIYVACGPGSSPDEVRNAFRWHSSYPGTGLLTVCESPLDPDRELTDADLSAMADQALGVLAAAFDAEGYLIAPVDSRLRGSDLACSDPC